MKKARKGKAAKVKPAKAQAKADQKALHGTTKPWTPAEVEEAFRRFQAAMPEPKGELHSVNRSRSWSRWCCRRRRPTPASTRRRRRCLRSPTRRRKWSALGEDRVRDLIKTIGLFRTKAKNVIGLSEKLIAEHGGQVPNTREALQELPGVGRKTANVVLNIAFGQPTMAVDTHIFRIGNRTGLAPGKDPLAVELKLVEVIPEKYMMHAHHWLILHGRYTCLARRPLCEKCVIADLCKWPGKTVLMAPER